MAMKVSDKKRRRTVAQVAHFVAMVHARERGQQEAVAAERVALARLGVRIQFAREGVANEK